MKLTFQDWLIRGIIYLQIFIGFSLRQEGLGVINPALPLAMLCLLVQVSGKGMSLTAFGNTKTWNRIALFFTVATISAGITLFTISEALLIRPIGVLISLGVFFLIYYLVSVINQYYEKALSRISHKAKKNGVNKLRECNYHKASSGLIK